MFAQVGIELEFHGKGVDEVGIIKTAIQNITQVVESSPN